MPSTGAILAFLAASLVLVLIPGPSVLFIVGRALAHGRRAALTSVAGNTAGVAILVVLVATGLGAIAAASATVFTVIKFAGAGYLVWLGVQTFRRRGDLVTALGAPAVPADRRVFLQGVVVGLTNPKALVFFAAVLPQFLGPHAPHPAAQLLVFGLLFCATAAVLDSAWGLAAGAARDWFATSPGRLRALGGTGGLVLVGMGVGLALTGRRD
ncbi:LysE family translocator [Pseudonocardia xishanensis]|uniref:LysE family translocator n=1 Tax=Pseudonocardia xishanensis TaxID=630995 RepID=A0ABP8RS30_9PSEU